METYISKSKVGEIFSKWMIGDRLIQRKSRSNHKNRETLAYETYGKQGKQGVLGRTYLIIGICSVDGVFSWNR